MGIDINRLAPWAQAQIARKVAQQTWERAENAAQDKTKERGKYNNTPTDRNGAEGKKIRFASKSEAARYDELMLMLHAGTIRDLKLQPEFTLQEAYTTPEGRRVRAIRYVADFSYEKNAYVIGSENLEKVMPDGWVRVVEDVKGGKATQTRVFKLKEKLLLERFGITIQKIGGED